MRGLMYREWKLLWDCYKLWPVPMLLVMFVWLVEDFSLGFLLCILASCLPLASFYADEKSGWDRTCAAMPLGPVTIVSARYLMTLLLAAMTAGFCLLIGWLQLRAGMLDAAEFWEDCVFLLHMGLVFPALCCPPLFRFGALKGIGWNGAVLFVFYGLHWLFKRYGPVPSSCFWFWIQPVLFVLSWRLSIRWYSKREF